jgi:hypothetical protein
MQTVLAWMLIVTVAALLLGRKWLPLGHLPGDFTFQRGHLTILVPVGSCILVSILATIVLALLARR